MNLLSREKQIAIISALTEGLGIRATARVTGTDRGAVAALALRVGAGCTELHDRMMVGLRTNRLELDELWSYVGKKQRRVSRREREASGDQYTYVALSSSTRAIVAYRTGKRTTETTDEFIQDLRQRVIGLPEISTDGLRFYRNAIRDAFGNRVAHGVINKTYSVTNLAVNEASRRYSPAEVIAVEREVASGIPSHISTSYVERSNLTLRMSSKRFARLSNGFSKRLDNHCAAVALHVAYYNLCRLHETLRTTPAISIGVTDHVWSIGELIEAALANVGPTDGRRRKRPQLRVVDGGKA